MNSGGEFTFRCRRMLRRFQIFHRFSTFALRLRPFGSVFGDGAPVCNENDAFPERNGYLNFRDGAPVCSENDARVRRRWNLHGNHRFAADRGLFTGCLFNRQPVQQATGEQATSELATGESLTNSSGICRNQILFSSVQFS